MFHSIRVSVIENVENSYTEDEKYNITWQNTFCIGKWKSTVSIFKVLHFVLQFLSRTELAWAFPHFVGACGRLIVLDHYGKPLLSFIDEPWDTRADLALQILHIIDAFIVSHGLSVNHLGAINMLQYYQGVLQYYITGPV